MARQISAPTAPPCGTPASCGKSTTASAVAGSPLPRPGQQTQQPVKGILSQQPVGAEDGAGGSDLIRSGDILIRGQGPHGPLPDTLRPELRGGSGAVLEAGSVDRRQRRKNRGVVFVRVAADLTLEAFDKFGDRGEKDIRGTTAILVHIFEVLDALLDGGKAFAAQLEGRGFCGGLRS